MNWYVLFVLSNRTNQLLRNLNKKDNIEAFIPQYQYYRRITKDYDIKPMFTNYIFVKSLMNQTEFNTFLMKLDNEKDGLIKQLVYLDTSALKEAEIEMFNYLLDESYVVKMSKHFYKMERQKFIMVH
ncbi:transcription termination/antitermination NusG family protein [Thomasclavelia cocleata]|uniref:transcription termination/antitermination NusG family protein n=1 Tax=Thomasclavelia cocleata TaxID=69824 RepID=UPI0020128A1F|nr:transcription termination/antitermination NusG family protein [Thomasclavelia cocleata]